MDQHVNSPPRLVFDHEFVVQGIPIPVSRRILSMHSGYFKELFDTRPVFITERQTVITDCNYDTFKALITYLTYQPGFLPPNENPATFLQLAHRYRIPCLILKCEELMRETVSQHNAVSYLAIAVRVRNEALAEYIVDFIRAHFHDLIYQPAWDYLAPRVHEMTEILKIFWRRKVSSETTSPISTGYVNRPSTMSVVGEFMWTPREILWYFPRYHFFSNSYSHMHIVLSSPSFYVGDVDDLSIHEVRFIRVYFQGEKYIFVDSGEGDLHGSIHITNGNVVRNLSYTAELLRFSRDLFTGLNSDVNPKLGWSYSPVSDDSNVEFSFTLHNSSTGKVIIMTQDQTESVTRTVDRVLSTQFDSNEEGSYIVVRNEPFFCLHSACRQISEILANTLRRNRSIFRWGNDDITPDEFAVVVKYMHTRNLPEPFYITFDVLKAAKTLQLDELFDFCDLILANRVNPNNAIQYFKDGHNMGASNMKTHGRSCLLFFLNDIAAADWERLRDHPELMLELLESMN